MAKLLLILVALSVEASADAKTRFLRITSNQSDQVASEVFNSLIRDFVKENPLLDVEYEVFDQAGYHQAVPGWLEKRPPDVLFLRAGRQLKSLASEGLLHDVSSLWVKQGLESSMRQVYPFSTDRGRHWSLPFSYVPRGMLYRKDVFKSAGLKVPKNWSELLKVCEHLKSRGITPFAIGRKDVSSAVHWFEHLNLRINGPETYVALVEGKVSFSDPKIMKVFEYWKVLVEREFFADPHKAMSPGEGLSALLDGKAAMFLSGEILSESLRDRGDDIGFFPFPQIDPGIPFLMAMAVDSVVVPKNAANSYDALKFLSFLSRPENLARLNKNIFKESPHEDSKVFGDLFSKREGEMATFLDFDTDSLLGLVEGHGFQSFMDNPSLVGEIVKNFDKIDRVKFPDSLGH